MPRASFDTGHSSLFTFSTSLQGHYPPSDSMVENTDLEGLMIQPKSLLERARIQIRIGDTEI